MQPEACTQALASALYPWNRPHDFRTTTLSFSLCGAVAVTGAAGKEDDVRESQLLPNFMIIGRMKCGTTTLSRWLAAQPEVHFCVPKEPQFFNDDAAWDRGIDWYSSLYKGAAPGQVLGEGTQGYTAPGKSEVVAERIARTVPGVRLVYMLRHPVDRIRSLYRHRRMWGQMSGSLLDSLQECREEFVGTSMYYGCLSPFIERFPREQILVVRMEDTVQGDGSGWAAALQHIGLSWRSRPEAAYNVSADQGLYRRPMRFLRPVAIQRRLAWIPAPLLRFAKGLLRGRGRDFEEMLEQSRAPIPAQFMQPIWEDIGRLEAWLGVTEPLWPREPDLAAGLEGPIPPSAGRSETA